MKRRVGVPEEAILATQMNIAVLFQLHGRPEEAMQTHRDVASGYARLYGNEHEMSLIAALNYASSLGQLRRYAEVKSLLCKTMPVSRRVLGAGHVNSLKMRTIYAGALFTDPAATLDDLREAVNILEDTERTARRVLGGAHPTTVDVGVYLRNSRAALHARETPSTPV